MYIQVPVMVGDATVDINYFIEVVRRGDNAILAFFPKTKAEVKILLNWLNDVVRVRLIEHGEEKKYLVNEIEVHASGRSGVSVILGPANMNYWERIKRLGEETFCLSLYLDG